MHLNQIQRIITLVFLVSLFSCSSKDSNEKVQGRRSGPPSALPVEGYVIIPEVFSADLQIAGTLIPMEETEIHPEISGKITMLSLKEGTWVSRGTLIARIFDEDLRAQLKKLQVQLEVAHKTMNRQNDLLKIGGISQQDFDLSVLNVNSLQADIAVLQTDIEKTYIRAPFNGRLGFKNVSIGAYVTPATVLTTIRQTDQLKVEFSVPEKYVSLVKTGNLVPFTTESQQGNFKARIISTESGINQTTRSLEVHAIVPNSNNELKPGGFANITFDLGGNRNVVMIPTQAIIPEARDKKVIVFNGGNASFVTVETGARNEGKVEIIKGLSIGDTIITTGLLAIKPGSSITISSYHKADKN